MQDTTEPTHAEIKVFLSWLIITNLPPLGEFVDCEIKELLKDNNPWL